MATVFGDQIDTEDVLTKHGDKALVREIHEHPDTSSNSEKA